MPSLITLLLFFSLHSTGYGIELGQPVDSEKGAMTTAPCLLGGEIKLGESKELKYSSQISRDFIRTSREFSVDGEGYFGIFKIGVELALKISDTYLTTSVYSIFDYVAGTTYLEKHAFVGESKKLNNEKSDASRGLCGDSFVNAITYGSRTTVALRFKFRNHTNKKSFEIKVKPWIGPSLFRHSEEINSVKNDVKGEIILSQIVNGENIFVKKEEELNESCKSSANDVEGFSASADLYQCIEAYVAAISFVEKHRFAKIEDVKNIKDLSPLGVSIRRYDQVGLWQLQPTTQAKTRPSVKVRIFIAKMREKQNEQRAMLFALDHIQTNDPAFLRSMDENDRNIFNRSRSALQKNLQNLMTAFSSCVSVSADQNMNDPIVQCEALGQKYVGLKFSKLEPVLWFSN